MSQFLSDLSEDDLHNLNAAGSALEYRQCNRIQNMSNSNLEKEYENLQVDIGRMVELTENLNLLNSLRLRLKMR